VGLGATAAHRVGGFWRLLRHLRWCRAAANRSGGAQDGDVDAARDGELSEARAMGGVSAHG
jgi:hypothetical protein